MASTRQERQLMRQRGAGTRKAKEVDFGFSFGGPAIDEPSVVEAPGPAHPPQATPPAESQRATRRTPGSARNHLPERPSTYDLPVDDLPEQTRSVKRRRINPPSTDTTTRQSPARSKTGTSSTQESRKSNTRASPSHAPEAVATNPPQTAPTKHQPPSSQTNGADSASTPLQETQPSVQSPTKTKQTRGRPRKSQSPNTGPQAKALQDTTSSPKRTRQTPNSQSKAGPSRRRSDSEPRPQAATEANAETNRTTRDPKAGAATVTEGKKPRGRPPRTVDGDDSTQTAEDVAREQETSKPKRGRGRPSTSGKARESLSRPEAPTKPTPTPAESSAPKGRGRKSTSKKAVEEPVPSPEPETHAESSAPKRGRPSGKKANRAPEPEPEEERVEDDRSEAPRRPARSPRGETVPITVHRLANASAWGGTDSPVDEEEESADELSTLQKTKLPNRGGVNPADVLSQICRETLEKTLATLKTGIANETNATRRAEWTRKRKAVEAFGSELDGRLLDLSEMLDSNFMLGVQLKKSKREMLDLRSHLYRVRKEREAVALQMDAVRAKHMEEENAKSTRTAINNSLHTLELALDRTQQRATTTSTNLSPSPADVEFMLRAVADDVSCLAPGAQGGLLTQMRAFNAQLEATARRLES
ncbi:hypothetical protein N7474_009985 [Penicillium riverlandense]|uniref:uncharacterized protein n=1 Tax=Penicillium riverlandense TaxID=1903569 RepID=UPI0025468CF2|nr:uncharacterized protein N7474_009985 [Penicillium riverlandense]KAJ5808716.1 hypothetical protein N7474_009985 [Penicillium riverlandense]